MTVTRCLRLLAGLGFGSLLHAAIIYSDFGPSSSLEPDLGFNRALNRRCSTFKERRFRSRPLSYWQACRCCFSACVVVLGGSHEPHASDGGMDSSTGPCHQFISQS